MDAQVQLNGITPHTLVHCRRNPSSYYLLFDHLLKSITTKRVWENRLERHMASVDELCTPSDEAFALLVLENCWDNWLDTFILHEGRFKQQKRKKKNDPPPESLIRSGKKFKYTTMSANNKASHKWSPQGIKRFNELYRHVIEERQNYQSIDRRWLDANHNKAVRKAPITDADYEEPMNDLVPR
jgi:hypothetical protein